MYYSWRMEKELQHYLYDNIPLSKALGIAIPHLSDEKVIVSAPFLNNINHKETVFGGSLHAVATLACWTLLYTQLKKASDKHFEIVITESQVSYLAPVDSDFAVVATAPEAAAWQRFLKILLAKGKARLELSASLTHKERLALSYTATFAAISVP